METADAVKPLQGLLVVSMEQAVAAPLCSVRLADAGARVIKIERIGGDFARGYDLAARGDSSYFAWLNHGKESIELDIKSSHGAKLLRRLIARADIFIQNFAPGAIARAGFGSKSLRRKHPRLITCDISGYGSSDAMQSMKAYDLLIQAESGLTAVTGSSDNPGRIGISLCDIGAGVTAYTAILEALISRGITDKGCSVETSLFDVAAEWMTVPYIHATTGNGAPERLGLKHPGLAPYGAFETSDGLSTLISIQNEREWSRLCSEVLDAPELLADERFDSNVHRVVNRDALEKLIQGVTGSITASEFRSRCQQSSIAFGALNSVDEFVKHIALKVRSISNSTGKGLTLPAHPVRRVDGGNWQDGPVPKVPAMGEHTEAITAEFSN